MTHRILICEGVAPEVLDYFRENGIEIKRGIRTDENSLIHDLRDCDAVLVRTLRITEYVITNSPRLKVIAKHGTGCDSIDVEAAHRCNIPIVYSPGANARSVAEHTIMLMLACSKKIKLLCSEYEKGNYQIKNSLALFDLQDKQLGLIGFGNVARIVAKIAKYGFDMKVVVFDPHVDIQNAPEYVRMVSSVEELVVCSDFVSIHVPLTESTKTMIDEKVLSLMKKSAYFINTSRGEIVDAVSLERAIAEGRIAGAGLDVSVPEPYMGGTLFESPNVILTPHSAASTNESMIRMGMIAARGVVDVLSGRKPEYEYRLY